MSWSKDKVDNGDGTWTKTKTDSQGTVTDSIGGKNGSNDHCHAYTSSKDHSAGKLTSGVEHRGERTPGGGCTTCSNEGSGSGK